MKILNLHQTVSLSCLLDALTATHMRATRRLCIQIFLVVLCRSTRMEYSLFEEYLPHAKCVPLETTRASTLSAQQPGPLASKWQLENRRLNGRNYYHSVSFFFIVAAIITVELSYISWEGRQQRLITPRQTASR